MERAQAEFPYKSNSSYIGQIIIWENMRISSDKNVEQPTGSFIGKGNIN